MNMNRILRKHFLHFLLLLMLFDITYSHDNDTSTESHRHGRVSGRIVKLYSGPKPDPILCVSEGFLPDSVDCSVFYRCTRGLNGKYTVYRFQCGPGTVYDPETEVCNHPRSTKRYECGGINSDKLISSTDKYIIENEIDGLHKVNNELPSPISTKPPKVPDSLLNSISTPTPVKLESSYTTNLYPWSTTSKLANSETIVASTLSPWNRPVSISTKKSWYHNIPTQATYYVTRQPSIQGGVKCTSDGFIGDNEDCRKFYRCVNNQRGGYIRYEFSCSESTIWDDDTQGCNHPWAVQRRRCGKGSTYNENSISYVDKSKNNDKTADNIIQEQTQFPYGYKVTQLETPVSTRPAIHNQSQINFGDRLNVENVNVPNQSQINNSATNTQSQTQFNYGNKITQDNMSLNTMTTTSTTYINSIVNKCTKEGFMGDTHDCKKFYKCTSNGKRGFTLHEFACSEGLFWDKELEACNRAWAVKECGGKGSSQNATHMAVIMDNTTVKYYTTASSSLYNNEIDEIGYVSQTNKQEYELPKSSTQITAIMETKPYEIYCKSSGFFGNKYDCAKFYRCVNNGNGRYTKYEYKCGDGTVWDSEIESCNHAWLVKSCSTNEINNNHKEIIATSANADTAIITTVSLIQTTTQKNIVDEDYDIGYQSSQKETSLRPTITTGPIPSPGNECRAPGFMGDNDCKKFYRCVENANGGYTRFEFTCGEGTVWDPTIKSCNHAWAVDKCGVNSINNNPVTVSPSQDDFNSNLIYNTSQDNIYGPEHTITATPPRSTTNIVIPVNDKTNNCEKNGFMGNEYDCKIFYRCVENGNGGYIRYEFSCGEGTVWDPKISACNHEWAVEKCGSSTSAHEYVSSSTEHSNSTFTSNEISTQYTTLSSSSSIATSTISSVNSNQCMSNGFTGDKHDCKKFYRCIEDGKGSYLRYEFSCGEGTVWDQTIQACNHAWMVKSCGSNSDSETTSTSRSTTMRDEMIDNTSSTQNQHIVSSTEYNTWISSTINSSTQIDDGKACTTDGFMGDNYDCKKFYRCVKDGKGMFIRYEFSCGEGTVWDSEINACNHVDSVKTPCSSMPTQTTERNDPSYTVSSSLSEDNYISTTTKEPPKSQHCEKEGFFGDKTDCKKFYRCTDNGQQGFHKYEFTCGEGTIWDQEILACNHPSTNLQCDSPDKETQANNSGLYSTTASNGISQSTEKTQTSSSTDICTSEGFYANAHDCKKFFRCVGDGKGSFTRYDFTCGEGTIWVQDIQACDHDTDKSLCSKGTIVTTTTTPAHSTDDKPVSISMSTIKSTTTDTSSFVSSTNPTMQDETVSGSSSTSETSSSAFTSPSSAKPDYCQDAGYFGNTQDCKKFYRCVDNGNGGFTKYDFTCGDGTIWDQDVTACNHPQDVSNPSCDNAESTSTPTTIRTTTSTTKINSTISSEPSKTTSSIESTTVENSHQSTSTSSTKKPNGNNNYTCTEAGFYADPYDCKKFYRCVDWAGDGKTFSIYHFDCGEGTIWDQNLQTCNHEESVYPPRDCNGAQSQTGNNNETTTTSKQEETTESSSTEGSTQQTTQKTTTQSSTTTESSSTTDQTSTQQSSTSEHTTSSQQTSAQTSTTEQSTTQKSTTIQQSTTDQSTTQQSTTEQSTTQKTSTTQQPTTSDQTSSTTTTEQTTTTANEETTTTAQTTTSESTTSSTDQTTKVEQTTTPESNTEYSTENQSSTTEHSTTQETGDGSLSSTTENGQETTTEQQSSDKECPETDDDQYVFVCPTGFRRHPKYCNLFYQCSEDDDSHEMKVAVFNCPNNTIYDESKTQCVEEEKADKKCDGQIAQRHRVKRLDANYKEPITVGKDKYLCPAAGHFPFQKNEQCSPVLFKCEVTKSGQLRGLVYQCPERYVYWSISRRCEPISIMTECNRSISHWKNRYEIPIERNNVARGNIK